MNKSHFLAALSFWSFSETVNASEPSETPAPILELAPQVYQVADGPWGNLEFFPLTLEPPDSYISLMGELSTWTDGTVWKFSAPDAAAVAVILIESGLSSELSARLTSDEFLRVGDQYLEVRPPKEAIEGLTPKQRSTLYPKLQPQEEQNPFFQPFTLMPGGIRANATVPSGVHQERLNLIEKLSFQRGKVTRFADVAYVFGKAANDDERWRIVKTMCRESSLNVRLKLSNNSDLNQLVTYWGSSGRNKEILPLLEAVVQTPGVEKLDLMHILPPTPRKLIHTFPSPKGPGLMKDKPDCFWTAFSFFSEDPPDRHLDFVGHVFSERYERAEQPLQFGDLILILDQSSGKWIHACNYIASDLVFTKNGQSMGRPWSVDRLERVVTSYLQSESLSVSFHRLKPEYRQ